MKKKLLLLGCVLIILIFIVSCKSNNIENETIIFRNYLSENNISGMGLDYKLKNIKKGRYTISLYSKEFENGKFVKKQSLYNKTLDFGEKLNKFDISVYQEKEKIKVLTGEFELNEKILDFFRTDSAGIAMFGIETEKKITIDNELPIIGYIIGDDVKKIESINIDEIFNHKSTGEIIIYLKISDIR